jgi:hypothetical protein
MKNQWLEAQIEEKNRQKSILRRNRSIELMKKNTQNFSCRECIHNKSGSCTDNLPKGCEYWCNPDEETNPEGKLGIKEIEHLERLKKPKTKQWLELQAKHILKPSLFH